ncbi:MAG: 4Fe-4S single cluster domain-containing protein [Nannocystaceae bacterium]
MSGLALRIAHRAACTASEGPHDRYALWVQGCTLACPGCCNPELFDPAGGEAMAVDELAAEVLAAGRAAAIEGLTVIGGEPLQQAEALLELGARVRGGGLGVIVFTGYERGEVDAIAGPAALAAAVDTLVCGRFDARRREPARGGRRFLGSQNQTLVHLSGRYDDPALWRGGPSIDVVITASGALEITGDPSLARRMLRRLGTDGDH